MNTIRFNYTNDDVRTFLKDSGFTEDEIADGEITYEDCRARGVNFDALNIISRSGNEKSSPSGEAEKMQLELSQAEHTDGSDNFNELTAAEVAIVKSSPKASALTSLLHRRGFEVKEIVSNMLGVSLRYSSAPTSGNHYDSYEDLAAEDLHGVHFLDTQVPNKMAEVGQSVLLVNGIYDKSKGSAIVTSEDGKLTSAYHVFFDKNGRFVESNITLPNGREITIDESMILTKDAAHDYISLKIDAGQPLKPLQFVDAQEAKGPFWCIGYPDNILGSDARHYTIGEMSTTQPDAESRRVSVDAAVFQGYSGGAIVDSEGRLVAIISQQHFYFPTVLGDNTDRNVSLFGKEVDSTIGVLPPPAPTKHP